MKYTIFCSLLCITIASSCGSLRKQMAEATAVQKIITDKYKLDDVGVSINKVNGEGLVEVTIENSPLTDSSDDYKSALADSIGKICVANIHAVKLSSGEVIFSEHHNYVVAYTAKKRSYDMHISK